MNYEEHFNLSVQKRDDFWKSIGQVNPDVIGNLINPAFTGGPRWPSLRQAFIAIETPNATIIASDGLSDPYDDYDTNPQNQSYNGLGLELYIATPSKFADLNAIIKSWEFGVLRHVAHTAASNPNLGGMLAQYRFISTTVTVDDIPENFLDPNGDAGVLLGRESKIVPPTLALSIETITLVNAYLLMPEELVYIMKNGAQGRIEIGERLMKLEAAGVIDVDRTSVV